jgi:rhodanese-related sulfurtransferase
MTVTSAAVSVVPGEVSPGHDSTHAEVAMTGPSLDPQQAWRLLQRGQVRMLDLRTELERRRYGAPPGAVPVSLARHVLDPEGEGVVYLCQHAVRSKATRRRGAAEVAGGFKAWERAGLPVDKPS